MSCRRPPVARVAALAAALVIGAAGCDTGDGRELAAPAPGATAPPLVEATTTTAPAPVNPPVGSAEAGAMVLGSAAFAGGQPIPDRYACTGDNVSPPLGWSDVPDGTVELALTVVDVDVPDQFVHWVVTGIDPAVLGFDEGAIPEGAVEARNDTSEFGWFGPCPPEGETHRYLFTLFALTSASGVVSGAGAPDAMQQIAVTPGVAATLTGTYTGAPPNP